MNWHNYSTRILSLGIISKIYLGVLCSGNRGGFKSVEMNVVESMIPMMVHLCLAGNFFSPTFHHHTVCKCAFDAQQFHFSKTQNERKGSEKEATRRMS